MAYVSSDGNVYNKAPWGFKTIIHLILGVLDCITLFFESLFGIDNVGPKSRNARSKGSFFGGSSGGGGGGGGGGRPFGPGGGGGGGPSKRMKTMRDINPPTMNAGGCPGGSCGM